MDTARLRFTSVKSTNDPSEFLFGRSIVERALTELIEDVQPHERKMVSNCWQSVEHKDFRAFVFCMSEASDDEAEVGELSQWRLYGANGRGIALVIDTMTAARRDQIIKFASLPRRVVYGEPDSIELVKSEARAFLRGIQSLPSQTRDHLADNPKLGSDYLANALFWLPSVIKHKAYRHEREVRLVRGDVGEPSGNPLVFFERNSIRRPAIELAISELTGEHPNSYHSTPISRVIIGPSGDQSAIEDSIKFFLEARNWKLEVLRSDIPYRAV
jgi:hypothetical protein